MTDMGPALVVGATGDVGRLVVEKLVRRYLGGSHPWFGGRDQTRVILSISAEKIRAMG